MKNLACGLLLLALLLMLLPQGIAQGLDGFKLQDEENVPKITAPFIMCHGGVDTTVPLEKDKKFKAVMDANNKVSELHIFDGVGHQLWKVKQDEVFALILKFFAKHLK